jgi:hypothetical protein
LHNCSGLSSKKIVGDENLQENPEFVERFLEVCGTSEPAKIQQLLNVSYNAVRNYLRGRRLPETSVLKTIAERTPYSLNWLLTGEGDKFVSSQPTEDTLRVARQIRDLVRKECVEVINALLRDQETPGKKIVVLHSDELKSEKVRDSITHSDK